MKYKKVLLLFPDYKGGHFGALRPPAGIGYLAQALQEEGIEYDVLDMATGCDIDNLKATHDPATAKRETMDRLRL